MTQIVDQCEACGGNHVEWRQEHGFFKGTRPYLYCHQCRSEISPMPHWSTWVMLVIAAAAAIWGWISVM